jgi:ketosteroid isomerase-like protein
MTAVQSQNADTIARFYAAFAALDGAAMAACYARDVRFEDPVFQLGGKDEVMSMWAMLGAATRAGSMDVWQLQWRDVQADGDTGRAHWEAHYRFSATGRLVHNRIDASFRFRDGLIVEHVDHFDFWAWARQALGAKGLLLGWTPLLHNKVRAQAATKLALFRAAQR